MTINADYGSTGLYDYIMDSKDTILLIDANKGMGIISDNLHIQQETGDNKQKETNPHTVYDWK